jgi:DNA ligase-1
VEATEAAPTPFTPKTLSITQVFTSLYEIASISGQKSQAEKINKIVRILGQCQGQEAKYFIRSIEGKLRIGLAERTVLVALAKAVVIASKAEGVKVSDRELAESTGIVKQVFRYGL